VDVARGLALIGIVAVNVLPDETATGAPSILWSLLAGRAAALFALIAGVSLALQSGGRQASRGRSMTAARASLCLRAIMIIAIGLVLGATDPPVAVILPYYGILFLLAVPLLGLGRPALFSLALVGALVGPVMMQAVRAGWPDMSRVESEYTFGLVMAHPGLFITDMLLTGFYPALPWVAYICVGLAVGRLDLQSRKVSTIVLGGGVTLAAGMWLLSSLLLGPVGGLEKIEAATPELDRSDIEDILIFGGDVTDDGLPTTTGWWLAVLAPYTSTPITILQTVGTSLAVLGAVLLLVPRLGRSTSAMAAAGSMTLTLYCAHVVILATEILDPERPAMSICIQVVLLLVFAVLWRAAVGKGPFETIIAAATRWLRALILNNRRAGPAPGSSSPEAKPR